MYAVSSTWYHQSGITYPLLACSQCIKYGKTCPGYTDEFELILRNETDSTKRKAQKTTKCEANRRRRNGRSSSSENDNLSVTPIRSGAGSPVETIILNPNYPTVEAAVVFFFRNFIAPPRCQHDLRGCVTYLWPMYCKSDINSALYRTTRALAMYTMSFTAPWRHMARPGYAEYSHAIREIRKAIQDPRQATTDETLMATLLASLFEVILRNPSLLIFRSQLHSHFTCLNYRPRASL